MNKKINFIKNTISKEIIKLQDKVTDNSFVKSVECDVDNYSLKVSLQNPRTDTTKEQLEEIGKKLIEELDNMTDEELLAEIEKCEPGPLSELFEAGFTIPGLEHINKNDHK